MFLYTQIDAIWCKVFPSTLTGIAQTWFKSLKSGIISSFSQLSSSFSTHFVSNWRCERTTGELLYVKQRETKSLWFHWPFQCASSFHPTTLVGRGRLSLDDGAERGINIQNDFIRGEEFDKAASLKKWRKRSRGKTRDARVIATEVKIGKNPIWSKGEMTVKEATASGMIRRGVNAKNQFIAYT